MLFDRLCLSRVIVYSVHPPAVIFEGRSECLYIYIYEYYQHYFAPPPVLETFYLGSADEKTNTMLKWKLLKNQRLYTYMFHLC